MSTMYMVFHPYRKERVNHNPRLVLPQDKRSIRFVQNMYILLLQGDGGIKEQHFFVFVK